MSEICDSNFINNLMVMCQPLLWYSVPNVGLPSLVALPLVLVLDYSSSEVGHRGSLVPTRLGYI